MGKSEQGREKQAFGAGIQERIENGQILVGSPATVIAQAKAIKDKLGCGILEVNSAAQMGHKTLKSLELFGTVVKPQIEEL